MKPSQFAVNYLNATFRNLGYTFTDFTWQGIASAVENRDKILLIKFLRESTSREEGARVLIPPSICTMSDAYNRIVAALPSVVYSKVYAPLFDTKVVVDTLFYNLDAINKEDRG